MNPTPPEHTEIPDLIPSPPRPEEHHMRKGFCLSVIVNNWSAGAFPFPSIIYSITVPPYQFPLLSKLFAELKLYGIHI